MKKNKIPTSYTIVTIALLLTSLLTYFVPVSIYDSETSTVIVGAGFDYYGNIIKNVGTMPIGFYDILLAPILGFHLASNVIVALLMAGGFLAVLNYTGSLQAGIGKLVTKLTGSVLIAVMLFIFAVLGTVFGFAEEIPAFIVVIIPLFVLAGYDVMTGLGVLFIGAAIGGMSSIVNPFSTGAAIAAIGNDSLSMGSGIILRIIIFVALYIVAAIMLIMYANKVKLDPKNSIIYNLDDVDTLTNVAQEVLPLTKKRYISLFIFISIILFLILGYVPWQQFYINETNLSYVVNKPFIALSNVPILGTILGISNVNPVGTWFFNEFSLLFLAGSIILKFVNNIPEKEFTNIFIDGAKDMVGISLVLSMSRGISVIMGSSYSGMSVTFIYWISYALTSLPIWAFVMFSIGVFIVIGLFLQSTSAVAGISMPILAYLSYSLFNLTHIGGEGGQILLITAFNIGLTFTIWLYPSAISLGSIEMVNVPYNYYLKFMFKFMLPLLIVATFILMLSPHLGLV
jgi:uncharacterized ion transporter superfamily protein YfcC